MIRTELVTRRIAWPATLRRWASWLALASLVSVADAKPNSAPKRDESAEVKRKEAARREQERKHKEHERAIQECIDDRDGDPDEDREICESEVGE